MVLFKKGFGTVLFVLACWVILPAQTVIALPGIGFSADILTISNPNTKSHLVFLKKNRVGFDFLKNIAAKKSAYHTVLLQKNCPQPFFCKIESDLEKKTNLPFKIRLGGVEYVDRLEGKY